MQKWFCLLLMLVLHHHIGQTMSLRSEDHKVLSLPGYNSSSPLPVMYSGYLSIQENEASPRQGLSRSGSLFYWFIEKFNHSATDQVPVVLWLNGGPGCSAMIGNFEENIGPFDIADDLTLVDNPYTWAKIAHVLFIDQPVGTGYSYAENEQSYTVNQQQVSMDMYVVLHKFFDLHPQYKGSPLYLTGESYSGKYIPEIAARILTTVDDRNELKSVLKGIVIGDGFSAPILQRMIKGEQAYWTGLLSKRQVEQVHAIESECIRWIQSGQTREEDSPCEDIKSYLLLSSGIINIYDVRRFDPSTNKTRLEAYLNRPDVRNALHASLQDSDGFRDKYLSCQHSTVYEHLSEDVLRDVRHLYPLLASHIKVLVYNGNFDLQDGPVGTEEYIRTLDLPGYHTSARDLWFVEEDVAGYSQCHGNFCFISAFGSGHFYPHDQKRNAREMLRMWMNSEPFCTSTQTIPVKFTTLTPSKYLKYLKDPVSGEYRLPCQIGQLVCTTVLNNCNGHGACTNGICQCDAGYTGETCERSINSLAVGKTSESIGVAAQEWKYFELSLHSDQSDRNELTIALQWTNSTSLDADLSIQIGEGFANDNPSQKVCLYGRTDGQLPDWNHFDFVVCEQKLSQLKYSHLVDLSKNKTYVGVFNTKPRTIQLSLGYTQDYPMGKSPTALVTNWKFWVICTIIFAFLATIATAASVYFRYQAAHAAPKEFARLETHE